MSEPRQAPIRVLFVCTGNSARSIIAETLLRDVGGIDFEVASAGTQPKGVNPLTVRALAEVGLDAGGARSKSVEEFLGRRFDYVITVCDDAREACPVFPGRHTQLHWSYPDPAAVTGADDQRLRAFRAVRDDMLSRLTDFAEHARRARAGQPAGLS